jgi:hypothetical protein
MRVPTALYSRVAARPANFRDYVERAGVVIEGKVILLTRCSKRQARTGSAPQNYKNGHAMTIIVKRDRTVHSNGEAFGLECPYCGVFAHMTPQSIPDVKTVLEHQPKHVGLVYQCDACQAPIFLRFGVKSFAEDRIELNRNFLELERPKERFPFSYLPKQTEALFREALSCYSNNNFNAFASMCRRAAASSFEAMGSSGKLRAFDEVMMAQDIAEIDDASFAPIKRVLFETAQEEDLPLLNRAQAGVLLEVMKDMFYQCFVRRGKLSRTIKVRRFFVQEANGSLRPGA